MPPQTISEAISGAKGQLTPTERRIALAITTEPTLLAFGSVSDLAEKIETSRPSIVRFAKKLGFSGYPELQALGRTSLSHRLVRPSDRLRAETTHNQDFLTQTLALAELQHLVDNGILASIAPAIADARFVWVATGETSRASAHALCSGLSMIRPNVRFIQDHLMGRDLADADPSDIAIVSDFSRYRRAALIAAKALATLNVPIITLTDGPLSPLTKYATTIVELSVPPIGPFDTSVPTVALAELIVAEVARISGDATRARVDRAEELWKATDTFVDPDH